MENERTIASLNAKVWYRLIKVVYLLTFVVAILLPIIGISMNYGPKMDAENSIIKCQGGGFVFPKMFGVHLYSENVSFSDDKKIRVQCLPYSNLGEIVKKAYPTVYTDISNEDLGKRVKEKNDVYLGNIEIKDKNYSLETTYTKRNWTATVGFTALSVVIVLAIFELFRRVFYYIFLGKVFPKKK